MYVGWGVEFFDYDNDGDLDIFIANGHVYPQVEKEGYDFGMTYKQRNQLFENKGDGTFEEVSRFAGPGLDVQKLSRGACVGDYDNDGDLDIFIANLDDTPSLLRNDGGDKNNWLMVKTIGTKSNRDGIGARIKVVSRSISQIREIKGGSSFLSQNDLMAHFGLGGSDKVELVEIRWPSGIVETFEDLPANQLIIVKEGDGIIGRKTFSAGIERKKEKGKRKK